MRGDGDEAGLVTRITRTGEIKSEPKADVDLGDIPRKFSNEGFVDMNE